MSALTNEAMHEAYGFSTGDEVTWIDADDNETQGTIQECREEEDGCGHYLLLLNQEGGQDTVPVSLVTKHRSPGTETWTDFE